MYHKYYIVEGHVLNCGRSCIGPAADHRMFWNLTMTDITVI